MDDHEQACDMLLRVSQNISRFPTHAVQLMTSTVVECQKVGYKKSAFDVAAILLRPENRANMDPKYRKKVESLIRRPDENMADPEPVKTPCPHCHTPVPRTELSCSECKNIIKFCIATVRLVHIDGNDLICRDTT